MKTNYNRNKANKTDFAMQWEYDSWNRTKSITYPDDEVLTYSYNNSGALDSMSAVKSQQTFNYLNNISYDKFGNRVIVNYGNGTSANYTYDSQTRRLSNLKSYDSQSNMMQDIDYDYDNAGNISDIENSASAINGLGGVYNYEYEYDSLYRLISSAGSFTDVNQTNYPFALDMTYSASGNISSKELTATTLLNGATTNIDYERNYNYYQNQAHTIENIHDQISGTDLNMQWDANGNMTYFNSSATGETRRMCWDEENRLAVVKDPNYASHYIYDAGGERTWKITGPIERMSINGGLYVDQTMLDYKTLYTSPYMVISDMEYTKHFYAESQRVTTKLGGGFSTSLVDAHSTTLTPIVGNIQDIADGLWNYIYENTNCVDGEPDYISIASNLPIVEELFGSNNDETDLYFYHPDHLGSSSFITDVNGDVNQHLQYLPFGESFIDQQTNHNIRFTFSSKEKDSETGFGYFGARYYNSDLSIWLSVDPLSDERPGLSPYNYCQWNPVMLIDPTGMLETDYYDKNDPSKLLKHVDDGIDQSVLVDAAEFEKAVEYSKEKGLDIDNNQKDAKLFTDTYAANAKKLGGSFTVSGNWPTIPNVLEGKKWYDFDGNCGSSARNQNYIGGGNPKHEDGQINTYVQDQPELTANVPLALKTVRSELKQGIPLMAGVQKPAGNGRNSKNRNTSTTHFINIVGQGNDGFGNFLLYWDSFYNTTNTKLNRLYYNSKTNTFETMEIPDVFRLTEIRPRYK